MGSANGKWVIGYRPFAKPAPAFVAWRHRVDSAGLMQCDHIQDERTGADALFPTKTEAAAAIRAMRSPMKEIAQ